MKGSGVEERDGRVGGKGGQALGKARTSEGKIQELTARA
jgi:hypothetical protein